MEPTTYLEDIHKVVALSGIELSQLHDLLVKERKSLRARFRRVERLSDEDLAEYERNELLIKKLSSFLDNILAYGRHGA